MMLPKGRLVPGVACVNQSYIHVQTQAHPPDTQDPHTHRWEVCQIGIKSGIDKRLHIQIKILMFTQKAAMPK